MERKKLEKFPEGVLEYISKIIGDCKAGSELTELFNIAGHPRIKHNGSTKWRFVYAVFKATDIKQEEDLCFVLMPFKSSFDRIYREQIKHTVETLGFKCIGAG
jgi:hypothetical protein